MENYYPARDMFSNNEISNIASNISNIGIINPFKRTVKTKS